MSKKEKKTAVPKVDVKLRDEVAARAMQALVTSRGFTGAEGPGAATMLARSAYAIADAMLTERVAAPAPAEAAD